MLRHLVLPLRRYRCSLPHRNGGASVRRRQAGGRRDQEATLFLPSEIVARFIDTSYGFRKNGGTGRMLVHTQGSVTSAKVSGPVLFERQKSGRFIFRSFGCPQINPDHCRVRLPVKQATMLVATPDPQSRRNYVRVLVRSSANQFPTSSVKANRPRRFSISKIRMPTVFLRSAWVNAATDGYPSNTAKSRPPTKGPKRENSS